MVGVKYSELTLFFVKIFVFVQSVRPTYLALYNDDSSFVVDTHTPRMLQDIGAKLSNKLAVLVVDLNLMCWRPAKYKYY